MTTSDHKKRQNEQIASAAKSRARVNGWTHNFYRYPARFSPQFARSVIEAYSIPGDWVIDPFVGGGTTLVEAMALGRNSLGIDISGLATFICKAKTLIMSDREMHSFENWISRIPEIINTKAQRDHYDVYAKPEYFRNLEGSTLWRIRKAVQQSLDLAQQLDFNASEILARCTILRTGQWALDGRKGRPSIQEFRKKMTVFGTEMLEAVKGFRRRIKQAPTNEQPMCINLNRSTAGAHTEASVLEVTPPRLILTSPPYPGIHVLYHRW